MKETKRVRTSTHACTRLIFLAHSFIFPFFVQTSNTRVAVERDNLIIWEDENMGNWNSWIYLFPPYLAVPSPGRTSSEPLGGAELVPPVFFGGKCWTVFLLHFSGGKLEGVRDIEFRRAQGVRGGKWKMTSYEKKREERGGNVVFHLFPFPPSLYHLKAHLLKDLLR